MSCLNRTIYVKPLESVEALANILAPHRKLLQSAGIAAIDVVSTSSLLALAGFTRITTFTKLPWPPMTWTHDGRGPLRELLTYHEIDV